MTKFGLSTLSFLCLIVQVLANTEIINFHVPKSYTNDAGFTQDWLRLSNTYAEHRSSLLPAPYGIPLKDVCEGKTSRKLGPPQNECPQELWVILDLSGQWSKHSSFTFRLSWPASHPANFQIQIYDPETLSARFGAPISSREEVSSVNEKTRLRYARIRVVEGSLRIPRAVAANPEPAVVPFIIVLEQLYFGFLPPSILPVLGYIAVACVCTCLIAPKIYDYLHTIAVEAEKEFDMKDE